MLRIDQGVAGDPVDEGTYDQEESPRLSDVVADSSAGIGTIGEDRREGDLLKQLRERDERLAAVNRALSQAILERELARALVGRPLVPGAATQLLKLWRDEFTVVEHSGAFQVHARDGRPLDQAVGHLLAQAEYAHFCSPATRGGVAVPQVSATTRGETNSSPRTLGDSIIEAWRATSVQRSRHGVPGLSRRRN